MADCVRGLGVIRQAIATDGAAIDAFLANYAETSMFLRNNLAKFGIGVSTEPRASSYWIEIEGGAITGVFGKSNHGYMMVQAPNAKPSFWTQIAKLLAGAQTRGITGVPEQVEAALPALGLAEQTFVVNKDEPLYSVALSDVTQLGGEMRLATTADQDTLSDWFTGYLVDTGLAGSPQKAHAEGKIRAEQAIGDPDVMLLCQDDELLGMAGINARVADLVQIGGVYTPPEARGQGFARRAVSGLLAHQTNATRSILFAADTAAARAYEAIGYKHIGAYRVAVLREPYVVGGEL